MFILVIICIFKYVQSKVPHTQVSSESYWDTLYLDNSFTRLKNFITSNANVKILEVNKCVHT